MDIKKLEKIRHALEAGLEEILGESSVTDTPEKMVEAIEIINEEIEDERKAREKFKEDIEELKEWIKSRGAERSYLFASQGDWSDFDRPENSSGNVPDDEAGK